MASGQYSALPDRDSHGSEFLPVIHPADSYEDLNPEHRPDHVDRNATLTPESDRAHSPISTPSSQGGRSDYLSEATARPSISISITRPDLTQLQFEEKDGELAASALLLEDRIRYSLSPSTHHVVPPSKYPSIKTASISSETPTNTARIYSYWRQTRRLWRLAASEWLFTAVLCGVYAGVLGHFGNGMLLSKNLILLLNMLLTTLTFLLGVNLAASMRSYAKLLRWLLLSLCWQPLETFDLILRCDSLLNVCRLIWKIRKQKENRRLRWMTQGLALIWLASNLALTLFVGMIGLASNIEPSNDYILTSLGQTQITDFSALETGDTYADVARIQEWGDMGFIWPLSPEFGYNWASVSPMQTLHDGDAYYFTSAWNPDDLSIGMNSWVVIGASTSCTGFDVIDGGDGESMQVSYYNENNELWNVTIAYSDQNLPGMGGFVAMSELCENCTTRSNSMAVFVAANALNETGRYFECTSSVQNVWWYDPRNKTTNTWTIAPDDYQFNNATARMLAGAIGWNGNFDYYYGEYDGVQETWQGVAYQNLTLIGGSLRETYGDMPTAVNMSDYISSFTMKALNMMDRTDYGLDAFKFVFGQIPEKGQTLSVNWEYAILLLVGIPVMQLAACMVVFAVGNKAIIKDDSPLSMAKLYLSILNKYGLAEKGCLMKGEEIVEYINKHTKDPQGAIVTYGWKDTGLDDHRGRPIGHLDVFEQIEEEKEVRPGAGREGAYTPVKSIMQDLLKVKKVFKDNIMYDGTSAGVDRSDGNVRRRRRHSASM